MPTISRSLVSSSTSSTVGPAIQAIIEPALAPRAAGSGLQDRVAGGLDIRWEKLSLQRAVLPDPDLGDGRGGPFRREVRPHEVAEPPENRAAVIHVHRLETVGMMPEDDVGAGLHEAVSQLHLVRSGLRVELHPPVDRHDDDVRATLRRPDGPE